MSSKKSRKIDSQARQFQFLQKYLNTAKKESKQEEKEVEAAAASDDSKNEKDWLTRQKILFNFRIS
jgi:hypothetical protein